MRLLFVAFIVIPIIEMWLLIKVGAAIGAVPTILLVLLTAVLGSLILRVQGLSTLLKAQQRLQEGQLPATEIIEGLILAVSGALLLTPGFVTDLWGFIGLLPYTRKPMVRWLMKRFGSNGFQFYSKTTHYSGHVSGGFDRSTGQDPETQNTIEGEYWEKRDK